MNQILIILHLLGLGGAVSTSVGNMVVMRLVGAAPGDAPILGKVPQVLIRVGQTALAILWLTGIIMVWTVYGGPANMPALFWVKFVLVLGVTAGLVMVSLTLKAVRDGDRRAGLRLPMYGIPTGILLVLVIIVAVYAFSP